MSGTISGTKVLVFRRRAWASGLIVYPSLSATRMMCSRVSALTASGREKARETVERCTPASLATMSMLRSATVYSFSFGLVGTPDDPHRVLQLAQRRHSAEPYVEGARDLAHERFVKRVAVDVDDGSPGTSDDVGERSRPVRVDRGESGLARARVAAVALQLRVGEAVPHLDDRLPSIRCGQDQGRVIFASPGVQGGGEPRRDLGGRVGGALQEQVDEVRSQVGQAASAGTLGVEHPRTAVALVARRRPGDEREPLVHRPPGLREPGVDGASAL